MLQSFQPSHLAESGVEIHQNIENIPQSVYKTCRVVTFSILFHGQYGGCQLQVPSYPDEFGKTYSVILSETQNSIQQ